MLAKAEDECVSWRLLTETEGNEGSSRLCWAQSSAGYSGAFWWENWEILTSTQLVSLFCVFTTGVFFFFLHRNMGTWVITNKNVNERKEKQVVQSFQWNNGDLAFVLSEHWTFGSGQNQQCSTMLVLNVLQVVQANQDVQPAGNDAAFIFTQPLCLICLCFFSSHRGGWDRMEKSFLSGWGGFRPTLLEVPVTSWPSHSQQHLLLPQCEESRLYVCVLYLLYTE